MAELYKVKAGQVIREMQLEITGLRGVAYRIRLARFLFWLGAKVAGMGIKFDDPPAQT